MDKYGLMEGLVVSTAIIDALTLTAGAAGEADPHHGWSRLGKIRTERINRGPTEDDDEIVIVDEVRLHFSGCTWLDCKDVLRTIGVYRQQGVDAGDAVATALAKYYCLHKQATTPLSGVSPGFDELTRGFRAAFEDSVARVKVGVSPTSCVIYKDGVPNQTDFAAA